MAWSDFLKPVKSLPIRSEQRAGQEWITPQERGELAQEGREPGAAEKMRRLFGLHPAVAGLAIITGGALGTAELGIGLVSLLGGGVEIVAEAVPLVGGLIAGAALAGVTYFAQQEWEGDGQRSAGIKAAMVGLLTALPGGVLGYKKLGKIMGELNS